MNGSGINSFDPLFLPNCCSHFSIRKNIENLIMRFFAYSWVNEKMLKL